MPNTKFKAGGKTYKHNIPTDRKFDGKEYYLVETGTKRICELNAKKQRAKGNLARVVKTPKGYEDANKKPYGLYLHLGHWK
jgi:hypothetical protein